jgi:hypothetical protein
MPIKITKRGLLINAVVILAAYWMIDSTMHSGPAALAIIFVGPFCFSVVVIVLSLSFIRALYLSTSFEPELSESFEEPEPHFFAYEDGEIMEVMDDEKHPIQPSIFSSATSTAYVLGDDGEITEVVDDEKRNRSTDSEIE